MCSSLFSRGVLALKRIAMSLAISCLLFAPGNACFAQAPTQTTSASKLTPAMSEVLNHAHYCSAKENLKGIGKVSVLVDVALTPASDDLLNADDLKTALELRLRSFGFKVESSGDPRLVPYVALDVTVLKQQFVYAYTVSVSLVEGAIVMRNMSNYLAMKSRESGGTGFVGSSLAEKVKSDSLRHLDIFINDWFAANGR